MTEPTIVCPSCHTEIRLTESLAAPLLAATRRDFEAQIKRKDEQVATRESALRKQQEELAQAQANLDEQVAEKLKSERARVAEEALRKARTQVSGEIEQRDRDMAELRKVLEEREQKLLEARQAQVALMRKERELEDARRDMELNIEKRVQQSLEATRDAARKEAEESLRLKVAEKEHTIQSMQRQIEELKRRAEQGSQQLQGEVQELELEALLRSRFPRDSVEPVPKGEHGGDALHRVLNDAGVVCGTLLWESKRTKNWSDGWLAKLREDQRAARADVAVLVSQALPRDCDHFALIDNVWVVHTRAVVPIATVLRQSLVEIAAARQAGQGQQTKTEMVYEYLTGPRFRQRVEAIVEAFSTMKEDLDRERKVMIKQWAKRDAEIEKVVRATLGMYGDLQGIAGRGLKEIDGLSLEALEGTQARLLAD